MKNAINTEAAVWVANTLGIALESVIRALEDERPEDGELLWLIRDGKSLDDLHVGVFQRILDGKEGSYEIRLQLYRKMRALLVLELERCEYWQSVTAFAMNLKNLERDCKVGDESGTLDIAFQRRMELSAGAKDLVESLRRCPKNIPSWRFGVRKLAAIRRKEIKLK